MFDVFVYFRTHEEERPGEEAATSREINMFVQAINASKLMVIRSESMEY